MRRLVWMTLTVVLVAMASAGWAQTLANTKIAFASDRGGVTVQMGT